VTVHGGRTRSSAAPVVRTVEVPLDLEVGADLLGEGAWRPRLSFTVAGRAHARPIVLVHGIGSSSAYFHRLVPVLARRWRVVALDLPGFGRSPAGPHVLTVREHAEVLSAFLLEHHLTAAVLLGHSLGTQVVADVLRTPPAGTAPVSGGAVLIGPTIDDAARSRLTQVWRIVSDAVREPVSLRLVQLLSSLVCTPRTWWQTSTVMLEDPLEEALADVTGPVVLVRGARDRVAPAAWVVRLAAVRPGSVVVQVPGAGHVVHWTHPEAVAELCRQLAPRTVPLVAGTP